MTPVANLLRRPALRGPRLVLVAAHVPFATVAPFFVIFGVAGNIGTTGPKWLAALCAPVMFGLQLRHSLAAAAGERPRGGAWTLLALAAVAYAPLPWLHINWLSAQFNVFASAFMVLDGWVAAAVVVGPSVYYVIEEVQIFQIQVPHHPAAADYLYWFSYDTADAMWIVVLYAAVQLVKATDELRGTRAALARAVVDRERLRISRDLHDLLGHSLSAISLKGDLAVRLLRRDTSAALTEIDSLTEVAREALDGLRTITGNAGTITLARELDNACALLADAGVRVQVRGEVSSIPSDIGEVMAWAVREGVTNILRHAAASSVVITLACDGGAARLEIVNDGVDVVAPDQGHGLIGLAARVQEASGTLSQGWLSGGRFQLAAQIPFTAAEEPHWTTSGFSSPRTST